MKRLLINILLVSLAFPVFAQSGYESVLQEIETNSTTLSALREHMEAQKLANRTGIYLPNPEAEFAYLWGTPGAIGNRTNIDISQSFDFPTAYRHRNQIAKLQNTNAELAYKAERINLLLSAKQVCIELTYYNALTKEYEKRLVAAEQIANSYKTKLDKGDTNIIEYNKAVMNLTAVQNEVTRIETERSTLLSQLTQLNGGKKIEFSNNLYTKSILPISFDEWYASAESNSPTLQYLSGQIKVAERQVKLNRALALPGFSAGYVSEKVVGEQFQGISVGVTIPLWENKNKIKQAKAEARAVKSTLEDNRMQFYQKLQNLFTKASSLEQSALKYRNTMTSHNNETLLKKAFDAGEISLLDYLLEIEFYYTAVNNVLEIEKNLQLTIAELSAVEL